MDNLNKLEKKIEKYKNKNLTVKSMGQFERPAGFIVSELLSSLLVGGFIGYHLDKFFNTKILFLLLLVLLGLVSAFYNIYNRYK